MDKAHLIAIEAPDPNTWCHRYYLLKSQAFRQHCEREVGEMNCGTQTANDRVIHSQGFVALIDVGGVTATNAEQLANIIRQHDLDHVTLGDTCSTWLARTLGYLIDARTVEAFFNV